MPDRHGFDHLPQNGRLVVACIHCPERGLLHEWREGRRRRHARKHARAAADAAQAAKEERDTILAGELLDQ
jgi:hypothetical protein